ncbi:hypothetical protein I3842_08G148300 [Carya illinoinensis]|uniref:Secreted protein n=1 Tax=Carya illinoinensis TaxID=32201 RepID=A0A922JB47_CARIL|nr:hypothetical protein I3842_08G148300 [Carya illinoinensis]
MAGLFIYFFFGMCRPYCKCQDMLGNSVLESFCDRPFGHSISIPIDGVRLFDRSDLISTQLTLSNFLTPTPHINILLN